MSACRDRLPGDSFPAAGLPAGRAAPRIILVDDAEDVRATIGEVLLLAGYQVTAYESGEAALADPDGRAGAAVLIADIVLGAGMDGIVLAEALKQRHSGLKVIYITGYFGANRVIDLRPQDRFLHKPFGITELLDAVGELTRPATA